MFRPASRPLALLLALSALLSIGLPVASATKKSVPNCRWDSAAGWVQRENLKVGNANWDHGIPIEYAGDFAGKEMRKRKGGPFSSWLAPSLPSSGPEGWFSSPSATCEQSVALHISGNGLPVTIKVFRMGYYGGAGARLIEDATTGPVAHYSASAPSQAPESLVTANWPIAWNFKVTAKTLPGQYLIRLDDKSGYSNFVPIMVTNPESSSPLTFISSILTWQAYNAWGGYSLYKGPN